MKKINIIILVLTFFGLYSCKDSPYINYNNKRNISREKKFCFEKSQIKEKIIKVGTIITNQPLCSQIITSKDGKEQYTLLDMNNLYIYDWETGILEDSVLLNKCGKLQNYSGFSHINNDTILVYNYSSRILYVVDIKGAISEVITSPGVRKKDSVVVDVESLNATRPLCINNRIILSGSVFGNIQDTPNHKERSSISIDLSENRTPYTIPYPSLYYKANWGGVYMNRVYHCDCNQSVLYSYPIEHNIYKYSCDFSECDTIYMGSQYIESIKSFGNFSINTIIDKEYRVKEFVSQSSYGPVLYDKYNNQYIRIAYHPIENWTPSEYFYQPFSIIVYNPEKKEIRESEIINNNKLYDLDNMHICKDGLAIKMINTDENVIEFKCFKF